MKGFEPRQKWSQGAKGPREILKSVLSVAEEKALIMLRGIAWPQPMGHGRDGDRRYCRWSWEVWGCLHPSLTGATVQSRVGRNTLKQPGPAVVTLAND